MQCVHPEHTAPFHVVPLPTPVLFDKQAESGIYYSILKKLLGMRKLESGMSTWILATKLESQDRSDNHVLYFKSNY